MNPVDLRQKIAAAWAGEEIPPVGMVVIPDVDSMDMIRVFKGKHWDDIDLNKVCRGGELIYLSPSGLKYYLRCWLDYTLNVNDERVGEPALYLMLWLTQRSERNKTSANGRRRKRNASLLSWRGRTVILTFRVASMRKHLRGR